MKLTDNNYVKELHTPPAKLAPEDQALFTEYFKTTMSGLLRDTKRVDEIGWRVISKNAADLAHEMVSAHKLKFK